MKTAFLISVLSPLALFGSFADKDWVKRTFAPSNVAEVADAAAVTNALQTSDISELRNSKQDVISDLGDIRSGATAGSTAVQPSAISDMATKTWIGQQDFARSGDMSSKQDRLYAGNDISITERAAGDEYYPFAYRIVYRAGGFLPGVTNVYSHWPDLETETHSDFVSVYVPIGGDDDSEIGTCGTFTEDGARIGSMEDPASVYGYAVRDRSSDRFGGGTYVDSTVTVPTTMAWSAITGRPDGWSWVKGLSGFPSWITDLSPLTGYARTSLSNESLGKVGTQVTVRGVNRYGADYAYSANTSYMSDYSGFTDILSNYALGSMGARPRYLRIDNDFDSADIRVRMYVDTGIRGYSSGDTVDKTVAWYTDIKTKTSELTNDSGFITSSSIPPIPTKVSDLRIDDVTTNVIREVTGTFWDPGLTVTWRMFCTNGCFYVSAITNVNVTGVQP